MAFTGDPKRPGYQRMEMIQFRPKSARFDFKEVVFDPEAKKANFAENPQSCKSCHRSDLRPNWEPYNLWRGSYFGVDNYITKGTKEWEGYQDYLANSAKKGRYQYFKEQLHDGTGPKGDDYVRGSESNRTFGEGVFHLNRLRLARKLIEHPDFPALKYAVMAAALPCDDIEEFIPKEQRGLFKLRRSDLFKDTVKHMQEENEERRELSRLPKGSPKYFVGPEIVELYGYETNPELGYAKQLNTIVNLRFLMENRGASSRDWSTSFNPRLLSFYDGTGPAIEYLAPMLAKEILKSDREFSKFFELSKESYYRARIWPETFTHGLAKAREACPLLKVKSLAALSKSPLRAAETSVHSTGKQELGDSRTTVPAHGATGLRWREHLLREGPDRTNGRRMIEP
jgi:hypothetical protein